MKYLPPGATYWKIFKSHHLHQYFIWPSSTRIFGHAFLKDWWFSIRMQNEIFWAAGKHRRGHNDLNSPGLTIPESELLCTDGKHRAKQAAINLLPLLPGEGGRKRRHNSNFVFTFATPLRLSLDPSKDRVWPVDYWAGVGADATGPMCRGSWPVAQTVLGARARCCEMLDPAQQDVFLICKP